MPAGIFFEKYKKDQAFIKWPIHYVATAVAIPLLYLWPLAYGNEYLIRLAIWVSCWSLAAAGLNLLFGVGGQISLAQGAFMALGAFTAIHLSQMGVPPLIAIPLSGLFATIVGLAFGLPSLRLKELYLLVTTLAAQLFLDWLFRTEKMSWFTGGAYAKIAPPLSLGPIVFNTPYLIYIVVLTISFIHLLIIANIGRSYIGRALKGIRDRDISAEIIGIDVFKYKLIAFALSAYYAAVGGALWGFATGAVTVESFTLGTSLEILAAVLIGGLGRIIWGSVLGSMFVLLVPEGIKYAFFAAGIKGIDIALRDIMFGTLILIFLLREPLGLTEFLRKIKERLRLFPFRYWH
ncbi:MAG: branched-chain amino acid ABC transporter permease [Pyrobaculum sp.]